MPALAGVQRAVERIPDAAVSAAARWFVDTAADRGGTMQWFGRRRRLTARIDRRSTRRSTGSTVTIVGTPASCWAIKSWGRRGGYDVTARNAAALTTSAPGVFYDRVHIGRSTSGDDRWSILVDDAQLELVDASIDALNQMRY